MKKTYIKSSVRQQLGGGGQGLSGRVLKECMVFLRAPYVSGGDLGLMAQKQ